MVNNAYKRLEENRAKEKASQEYSARLNRLEGELKADFNVRLADLERTVERLERKVALKS